MAFSLLACDQSLRVLCLWSAQFRAFCCWYCRKKVLEENKLSFLLSHCNLEHKKNVIKYKITLIYDVSIHLSIIQLCNCLYSNFGIIKQVSSHRIVHLFFLSDQSLIYFLGHWRHERDHGILFSMLKNS